MKLEIVQEIIDLSKKSYNQLYEMNKKLERAYVGEDLTKNQLIYQIAFLMDAPDKRKVKK